MSGAPEFLQRLVGLLGAADVPYMVAGSFTSTYHGVPRTTHDIDVLLDLTSSSLNHGEALRDLSSAKEPLPRD